MSYIRQIQQTQPNKRRRHDDSSVYTSPNGYSRHITTKSEDNRFGELRIEGSESLHLDLSTLPTPALHRYMTNYRLAEHLPPKPKDSTGAVVLPFALRPTIHHHPSDSTEQLHDPIDQDDAFNDPSNPLKRRPSRKSSRSASIGVSAQQDDDDMLDPEDMEEEAILPDIDEAHELFNDVVSTHYRHQNVREVDSVVNFVHALRSKDKALRVLPRS
ncbi:hypothetical protein E3P92_02695 [Wallemia ichthyophaga]|uniref:Histone deacetylase complex subunit SAP30 Sin3 binding domain-containing protein n=2 Tax=Wallemia ichthyophaga TaxID=245174 RepID=A0A4T0H1T0_WALIC|nr:uncharacterized protein J056_002484 [Wallemia ichthyophaga EXF-994]TIA69957.1 hypothetical protein E3P91_03359 [Wallemia ichthyophaga]EOQ99158.1 hypothetical protein J056_002484 [Wallemia ichthyophaga EXF-994]TIA87165.1 hypothetical protein E3P97_04055 [Wallemia ichthyophaga]TIA97470.1 hypothetical protein E3P94_03307 [Wallemia ichthyophaga]TIA98565.1 hypothetical protein E3P95_02414 [Wallemia ichthyophaga]